MKAVEMAQAKRAVLAVGGGCDFVISGPKHQRQRGRSDWSGFHKRDAPMSGRRRPGRSPRKVERAVPPQVIDMACRAADGDRAERGRALDRNLSLRPTQRAAHGRKTIGSGCPRAERRGRCAASTSRAWAAWAELCRIRVACSSRHIMTVIENVPEYVAACCMPGCTVRTKDDQRSY
jgi:hypothetical protein